VTSSTSGSDAVGSAPGSLSPATTTSGVTDSANAVSTPSTGGATISPGSVRSMYYQGCPAGTSLKAGSTVCTPILLKNE
jgi:hypothetical protein